MIYFQHPPIQLLHPPIQLLAVAQHCHGSSWYPNGRDPHLRAHQRKSSVAASYPYLHSDLRCF